MDIKDVIGESLPNCINNPFKKECIEGIHIHMIKRYNNNYKFTGSVEFVNNGTEGVQRFEGKDLAEVFIKIKEFCLNL